MLNKIHYAIEINTTSDLNIPEIGMVDGSIRYITDGVDTTGYTFEDGAPVVDAYYTEFLKKDGVQPSNQSIDIIAGGDYAFLGSLNTVIVNYDELHIKMLKTENLYLIGAEYKLYIIIDNVMYSRWTGVVSELKFDDKSFTFVGKDKHNADNETVKDKLFGYTDAELNLVVDDEDVFIDDTFIKMIAPRYSKVTAHDYTGHINEPLFDEIVETYCGMGMRSRNSAELVSPDNNMINVYLSGTLEKIKPNMFLRFNGDSNWYQILDVFFESLSAVVGDNILATRLVISGITSNIIDYTTLYGKQPDNSIGNDVAEETNIASENKLTASIYEHGISYTIPNDAELVTEDGKYVAETSDGEKVLVNGVIKDDKLILSDNNYSTIIYPTKTRAMVESKDGTMEASLNSGLLKHLEDKNFTSITPPNDLGASDDNVVLEFGKYYYYIAEFDEDISEYKIGLALSAESESIENWTVNQHGDLTFLSPLWDGSTDVSTTFISPHVNNYYLSVLSNFTHWEITQYNVVVEEDFGEVPFLSGGFSIPNVRNKVYGNVLTGDIDGMPNWNFINFWQNPSLGTNMARDMFNSNISVASSYENVLSWRTEYSAPSEYRYPDGQIELYSEKSDSPSSRKVLIQVKPRGSYTPTAVGPLGPFEFDVLLADETGVETSFTSEDGAITGLNTICAFKTTPITPSTKLLFKTHNPANDNYVSTIKELSGSQSVFNTNDAYSVPDRHVWWTGRQIGDEINTFNLVTTLCKQGFVAGLSDRFGDVILKEFLDGATGTTAMPDPKLVGNVYGFEVYYDAGKWIADATPPSIFPMFEDRAIGDIGYFIYNSIRYEYVITIMDASQEIVYFDITNTPIAGMSDYIDYGTLFWGKDIPGDETHYHDNNIIIDKSIKSFQLSPISKCYNEFTVKYHYSNGDYQKEIGIYNVDEGSFPEMIEYSSIAENGTGNVTIEYGGYMEMHISPLADFVVVPKLDSSLMVDIEGEVYTGVVVQIYEPTGEIRLDISPKSLVQGDSFIVPMENLLWSEQGDQLWKTFVSGVDDYTIAKELWEKAHASWLINQRIRTAPSDRTSLKWCVDLNEFYDNNDVEFPTTYQWHYTNQLVDWTTRQKFQVSYSLPLTVDTVKLNLMDKIEFNDPVITPNIGTEASVGKGWITGLQVDSKKDLIKVQITFEPEFMSMALPVPPKNDDIWEQGQGEWDDIIEASNNVDDIIEVGVV